MLRKSLYNNQAYHSSPNRLNNKMSRSLFLSQDSADDMSENTPPEVVDTMEGDSKTPDSINMDDGYSDASSKASKSTRIPAKKNGTNQLTLSVSSSLTTMKKSSSTALEAKRIPSASCVGVKTHIPQKTSKNLQIYMGKLEKYVQYIEMHYSNIHKDLCEACDEYNEVLKMKTKSINQFHQLTERANKATSTLAVTKIEYASAKDKQDKYKAEVKELTGQLKDEQKKRK